MGRVVLTGASAPSSRDVLTWGLRHAEFVVAPLVLTCQHAGKQQQEQSAAVCAALLHNRRDNPGLRLRSW